MSGPAFNSATEAFNYLNTLDNVSFAEIKSALNSIDVPSGAGQTTVLYSGVVDEVHTSQHIAALKGQETNFRFIDDTEAAKFLIKHEGWMHGKIIEELRSVGYSSDPAILQKAAEDLVGGGFDDLSPELRQAVGLSDGKSLWAVASENFVSKASGNVVTLTSEADAGRIYAQTEFPAALNNSSITHLNGIELTQDFRNRIATEGIEALRADVDKAARDAAKFIEKVDGDPVFSRAFFDSVGVDTPPTFREYYRKVDLNNPDVHHIRMTTQAAEWAERIEFPENVSGLTP